MAAWSSLIPCSLALLLAGLPVQAQQSQSPPAQGEDLAAMDLEELMNVKVTSVTKTEEGLSRTASAVFVIGPEDIRASGALNIPDLLRMVPGVDVAQITANSWAISVRGFNGRFSNKLLVLLDGRAVYTPTIGGVFWDVLDVPLEDIARIEVIRGPGGSVWGANAFSGVINILTRKADQTRGGVITAGGGNLNQGFGTVQYGGSLANKTDFRLYSKYSNEDHTPNAAGEPGGDGWHLLSGGFRTDTRLSGNDTLMFQGNIYTGAEGIPATHLASPADPVPEFTDASAALSGGYLQSVWNHNFSERIGTTLEVSYNSYQRDDALREGRKSLNLDFQNHFRWGSRHAILWGLSEQYTSSHSDGSFFVSLAPPAVTDTLFGFFLQDEISLIPNRLYATVGARVERSYYTGWAPMPSARLAWEIDSANSLWAAFSRPVRTPAESDIAIRSPIAEFPGQGGLPTFLEITGNRSYGNEILTAYEIGYRSAVSPRTSLDFAAYYNDYDDLQTTEPGAPFLESSPAPLHLIVPLTYGNLMYGEAHGLELATQWKVTGRWSLRPGYAFEEIHMHTRPSSQDTTSAAIAEGSSPRQSAQLRSSLKLSHGLEWSGSAYFVDRLRALGIPSYTRVDTQLTWKWGESGTFSVVGQNLLTDHHFEFQDYLHSIDANQAKRSAYGVIRWSF